MMGQWNVNERGRRRKDPREMRLDVCSWKLKVGQLNVNERGRREKRKTKKNDDTCMFVVENWRWDS